MPCRCQPQTTCLHPALSRAAASIFLQLYLYPAVHMSFFRIKYLLGVQQLIDYNRSIHYFYNRTVNQNCVITAFISLTNQASQKRDIFIENKTLYLNRVFPNSKQASNRFRTSLMSWRFSIISLRNKNACHCSSMQLPGNYSWMGYNGLSSNRQNTAS